MYSIYLYIYLSLVEYMYMYLRKVPHDESCSIEQPSYDRQQRTGYSQLHEVFVRANTLLSPLSHSHTDTRYIYDSLLVHL